MFSTAFHRVNLSGSVLSAQPMWGDFPRGGLVSLPLSLFFLHSLSEIVRGREDREEHKVLLLEVVIFLLVQTLTLELPEFAIYLKQPMGKMYPLLECTEMCY